MEKGEKLQGFPDFFWKKVKIFFKILYLRSLSILSNELKPNYRISY